MIPTERPNPTPARRRPAAGRTMTVASLVVVAACVILLASRLPIEAWLAAVDELLRTHGPIALVAFVLLYIGATLSLAPVWVLMLAAGAALGPVRGTLLTLVAATVAAAAAFGVARYVARERVLRLAQRSPHFAALDAAVGQSGWKLVALMRLSPMMPFAAQSYAYGLTPIRFWPCVLATFVAMTPEAFMYAYLGHAARRSGAAAEEPVWTWVIAAAGVAATIAATAYVGRLTRQKLREQPVAPRREPSHAIAPAASRHMPRFALASACAATAMLVVTTLTTTRGTPMEDWFAGLLGPAAYGASEAFADHDRGPAADHTAFDRVLRRVVTEDGWVDYEALRADPTDLTHYLGQLRDLDFDALDRDEKLATLINAYNAFTLQLILDHWPVASIKDIPEAERWKADRWRLGGHTMSLDEIEHAWLRVKFVEPRIHFAIVCASVGCPPLRNEAFVASRIDEQLEDQARRVHAAGGTRWARYDAATGTLRLTKLYQWFAEDFEAVAGSAAAFAARYLPELRAALEAGREPAIEWLDYDWSLNTPR